MFKVFSLLITFIFINCNESFCQNYFEIKPIKSGADLSFPILKNNTKDSIVIEKINYTLQLSELEKIDKKNTDIFSKVRYNDVEVRGVDYKTFTIENNNNRIFSLKFFTSGSFASTSQWHRYYTFNSKNGSLIHLQDIFTKNGYQLFKSLAVKRRLKQLKKETVKLDTTFKNDFEDVFNTINNDNFKNYFIKDSAIWIDEFNLQSKYQRIHGLNLITIYKLKELKPYLNNYGEALFGLAHDSFLNTQTNLFPQLYKGFVRDSFPIVMLLEKHNDTEINGYYVYTKYGIGIELNGSLIGNKLSLVETNWENKPNAFIDATYSNALLLDFGKILTEKESINF